MKMYSKKDYSTVSQQVKAGVTISLVWEKLYGTFPRKWSECRCPWREDKNPSFSVSGDGQVWFDHGTGDKGEAASFPAIALCEGGPDFLAALGHAWASGVENQVAPICISSASSSIPDDALPAFSGKRVRVFGHADDAGMKASERWRGQLTGVASKVDCWRFGSDWIQANGETVIDLNDLLRIDYDCWEDDRATIEGVMAF